MKTMRVKIKELLANPFRDLSNYPFNQEKIERLKQSIEATGFWDNILARQVNGQIQIAYGHHRLKALQEVYPPNYEIEVPIKDLSDELMLKIMANENMEEWQSSVIVIDETVKATRNFLSPQQKSTGVTAVEIAKFLGWPEQRVHSSFVRINAIEKSGIDKQAVETIPTAKAATAFTAAAKAHKLDVKQQRRVAKKIADSEDYSVDGVKKAVMDEAYPKKPKEKKQIEDKKVIAFTDFLIQTMGEIDLLYKRINVLNTLRAELTNYTYDSYHEKVAMMLKIEQLKNRLTSLMNDVKQDIAENTNTNLLNK